MDLKQLRSFLAVAEELSFTAAARRLHMTQPPLSMQIMALEQSLGVQLFDRTRRAIALTEAGQVLLPQVRQMLGQLAGAVELAQRTSRGEAGRLRVAFTGSVPLVPGFADLLRAFRRERPLTRLEIEHLPTGEQLQALEERRIDVGLLRPAQAFQPSEQLTLTGFWRDELRVVAPDDHALVRARRVVSIEALAAEPLILFPRGAGCGLHDHVVHLCHRLGRVPKVVHEAREGATIVGLVAAGVGISLLPDSYARLGVAGVRFLKLAPASSASRLYLAHRSDASDGLTRLFVELAITMSRMRDIGESTSSGRTARRSRSAQGR